MQHPLDKTIAGERERERGAPALRGARENAQEGGGTQRRRVKGAF